MKSRTDIELFQLTKAGRNDAFEELFHRYRQKAFNVAYRTTGVYEAAEDIVMESFIKLYQTDNRINTSFSSYFYRLVINTCYNYVRKQNRTTSIPDESIVRAPEESDPLQAALMTEAEENARKALDSLPVKLRCAFILTKYEGLSYRETSEIMHVSEKALGSMISRAREKLQKYYREEMK